MIKKGFTLAEVMVVVLIFAVVSVSTMMITKSKNNYVNKYMSYTAFTNLQEGIGELIADGYDSNSDGTLEAVLPPFGHAGATPVCNPDPCAGTITVGSLEVAKCDTADSIINNCSDTTWDSNLTGNFFCATNHWAGARKSCSDQGMRLPSLTELAIMYRATSTGMNNNAWYWSETEYDSSYALSMNNIEGLFSHENLKNYAANVRCVEDHCGAGMMDIDGLCVALSGTPNSAINTCSDTKWDTHLIANPYCATNYWAGAKKACSDQGMRLPSVTELATIYASRAIIAGINTAYIYWSSTENGANYAWVKDFAVDDSLWALYIDKNNVAQVRCVK